jgi:hypothetical protein
VSSAGEKDGRQGGMGSLCSGFAVRRGLWSRGGWIEAWKGRCSRADQHLNKLDWAGTVGGRRLGSGLDAEAKGGRARWPAGSCFSVAMVLYHQSITEVDVVLYECCTASGHDGKRLQQARMRRLIHFCDSQRAKSATATHRPSHPQGPHLLHCEQPAQSPDRPLSLSRASPRKAGAVHSPSARAAALTSLHQPPSVSLPIQPATRRQHRWPLQCACRLDVRAPGLDHTKRRVQSMIQATMWPAHYQCHHLHVTPPGAW